MISMLLCGIGLEVSGLERLGSQMDCYHGCVMLALTGAAASLDSQLIRLPAGPIEIRDSKPLLSSTVRLREIGTGPIGTILRFTSVPSRKIGTLLLGGLDSVFYLPCTV